MSDVLNRTDTNDRREIMTRLIRGESVTVQIESGEIQKWIPRRAGAPLGKPNRRLFVMDTLSDRFTDPMKAEAARK